MEVRSTKKQYATIWSGIGNSAGFASVKIFQTLLKLHSTIETKQYTLSIIHALHFVTLYTGDKD